jgi:hypothetical protein
MDRVTTAPVEESPGDYDVQYSMVRHLESRTATTGAMREHFAQQRGQHAE